MISAPKVTFTYLFKVCLTLTLLSVINCDLIRITLHPSKRQELLLSTKLGLQTLDTLIYGQG